MKYPAVKYYTSLWGTGRKERRKKRGKREEKVCIHPPFYFYLVSVKFIYFPPLLHSQIPPPFHFHLVSFTLSTHNSTSPPLPCLCLWMLSLPSHSSTHSFHEIFPLTFSYLLPFTFSSPYQSFSPPTSSIFCKCFPSPSFTYTELTYWSQISEYISRSWLSFHSSL